MHPVKTERTTPSLALAILASLLTIPGPALPFTVTITAANPRIIYLQVGVGSFSGLYNAGGTPLDNPTVNVVSVTVPAAQVGTGTPQSMTSNSTASNSFYDNFVFCNAPQQVYIGGFYRSVAAGGAATVRATVPASLVSAAGDTIPFSQISWTSSGNSDGTAAQPFPAGTFAPGTQVIGAIQRNQWAESCHSFVYANSVAAPAGTYTGRVTYTASTP